MFGSKPKTKKPKPVRQLKKTKSAAVSTQAHVPFSEIRDGVVLMRDGSLRRVLLVSSLNFALKSEDEQKAIIQGYVAFLNTLDFELQIVVQSRKLNIDGYLEKLERRAKQQDNELLRKQTVAYRSFIAKLVEEADIMDKKFFVVIPYTPSAKKTKNYWNRLQEVVNPFSAVALNKEKFAKYKLELDRRVSRVVAGLQSINLHIQPLDTQSLIEVYYNTFNPITKQQRRVTDVSKLAIDWTEQ